MAKDYYTILGIPRTASQEEIKKAFRKIAHQYHPDKGTGNESKFKEANEAYQVLSDPKKRSNYDNFGFAYNDGGFQGQYSQGFDFSDLFGGGFGPSAGGRGRTGGMEDIFDLFSDAFGYRQPQQEDQSGGENLYIEVAVGKNDLGTTRVVEYEILGQCSECSGHGVAKGYSWINCKTCGGSGQVKQTTKSGFGYFSRITVCPHCKGKGKMPEKECSNCKGNGRAKTKRKLEIRIPNDLNNAYDIVVPKGGNVGKLGAEPGNLVIHLKLK
ncbi:MAG: DnaJ domain-containing protein [Candidatus Paceibacterota bacterium]